MSVSSADRATVDDWDGHPADEPTPEVTGTAAAPLVLLEVVHPAIVLTFPAGVICHKLLNPAIITFPFASTAGREPYVGYHQS